MTAAGYRYPGGELALFSQARNWQDYVRAQIAPCVSGRVLEVGAGIGGRTGVLCGLPGVSGWTALEPDPGLFRELSSVAARWPRVTPRHGALAQLGDSERFDCILYLDVLEHIPDDRAEVAAAADRLADQGKLVVLSPAHQGLFSEFDRAIGHCRRYDRESLGRLAGPTLRQERLVYLDSLGALLSLGNRVLLHSPAPTAAQLALWDRVVVPASRVLDPLLGYRVGKSILGVWRR